MLGALTYTDGDCNTETYRNDQFVELESPGPLNSLIAGGEVTLTETWELHPGLDVSFLSEEIRNAKSEVRSSNKLLS